MDDLEGARQMGRQGQTAIGLSVQEQGEYDRGRRERDQALNGFSQGNTGGGGGGIGVLFLLAMAAPAFLAPGLALWATWDWFATTQGWEWPVLLAICIAEGIAFLFLFGLLWKLTPAVVISVVLALYLGVAYAICLPPLISTGFMMTAILAMAVAAAGFFVGLNAPNGLMSSFIITTAVALGLGAALNLFGFELMLAIGLPWLGAPIKWAGAGLALGAILRLVFKRTIFVLAAAGLIAAGLFLAPGLLGEFANQVTGASMFVRSDAF